MKKLFLIISLISLTLFGFSQEGYIGIGIGPSLPLGDYSDTEAGEGGFAKQGWSGKLIDFHYKFNDNIGIAYSWWGHNHPLDEDALKDEYISAMQQQFGTYYIGTEVDADYWGFPIHTVGLLFSTNGNPFDFNVKASIAITPGVNTPELAVTWPLYNSSGFYVTDGYDQVGSATSDPSTGFSLGVGGKYYINDSWAMTVSLDYFALEIELPERNGEIYDAGSYYYYTTKKDDLKINLMNVSFGIGYVW